jgi:hypothetical protein
MKKLMLIALLGVFCAGLCHAQTAPYKASYSSNFTIADKAHANKVLTLWKDFENNTLDKHIAWFADTVSMTMADGKTVKGKAENLKGVKEYRKALSKLKVTVDAWVSLKSTDQNENVVCVWGTEEYVMNGKKEKHSIQEVWGFNKDGKIAMMLQYSRVGGM